MQTTWKNWNRGPNNEHTDHQDRCGREEPEPSAVEEAPEQWFTEPQREADVPTIEPEVAIRIAEMNAASMGVLVDMHAKIAEQRAGQASDITPPKREGYEGLQGLERQRSRLIK